MSESLDVSPNDAYHGNTKVVEGNPVPVPLSTQQMRLGLS